ncbi:poly-beta-1,6-N-acetyl-D-glucosamine biosynthesis protein PgaD [Acinetobacter sp. HR7]|uniref:poly-beta-1,6-N-acetyl-D-glucosamine biosynthesis protein PgaD n=1 Tax=Acinetobacter sp. HR7 TaxID=1509403 RepID=UPI0005393019|nr:poly-beta-1,6-N-acetyl-D-glucosamine biosynthesis protein PgaD [Acinetobacter sp. HR7]KGT47298.1 poly-beta-1,6-N-acetyl-D-glucosamine biosynthesis protein PgaD [Acinetobacter sp. HR7]
MPNNNNNTAQKQIKIAEYIEVPAAIEIPKLELSQIEGAELDIPEYIDVPEYVKDRTGGYTLMTLGWMAWAWLFMPLVSLALWWFQSNLVIGQVLSEHTSYQGLTLIKLTILIVVAFLCLLIWASYNWIRFNGVDRRSAPKPVELQQIASSFALDKHALLEMVQAKNLTLHYNREGKLEQYDIQGQIMKVSSA